MPLASRVHRDLKDMPFYEYECSACKHHVEVLQKISDAPLRKCPDCGKQALKRLISAPVFRLKGGGWYETDFKSDNERKRNIHGEEAESKAAEPKAPDSSTGSKAEPKAGESKPEPAKEAKPAQPTPSSASGSRSKKTAARKPLPKKAAAKPAPRKKASRR